jgi:hypothetical protein
MDENRQETKGLIVEHKTLKRADASNALPKRSP